MKHFIIFAFCITLNNVNAQSRASRVRMIDSSSVRLNAALSSAFIRNFDSIGGCGSGYIFIKFEVGKSGQVSKINFSEGAPPFMENFLRKQLTKTSDVWHIRKIRKKETGIQFFLPVYYQLNACKENRDTVVIINHEMYVARLMPGLENMPSKDSFYQFRNMLNFGEALNLVFNEYVNARPLKCTMLSPIILDYYRSEKKARISFDR